MGIFNRNKKQIETRGLFDSLSFNYNGSYKESKAMRLSAVYRCVEVISDAIAQLPLEPYLIDKEGYKRKYKEHPTYNLLSKEPNKLMSRFTFIKTLVVSTLLKGNGYAYISRDNKGNATSLTLIPSDNVKLIYKDGNIEYSILGFPSIVESINMIHILNFSYDGINGISTLSSARTTLGIAADSESHTEGFFKGGANLAGILKVQSSLSTDQKNDLKKA
jgi:HK97 family phage portal protein